MTAKLTPRVVAGDEKASEATKYSCEDIDGSELEVELDGYSGDLFSYPVAVVKDVSIFGATSRRQYASP